MKLAIGIVGLPNVGKSTLFNALLKKQIAFAANYPFATIEPNVGVVEVPDARLEKLADIIASDPSTSLRMTRPPIIPAAVQFYDIAGLVKGASQGEGLGNKFLSHIREVAAIAHVTRLFEDGDVIHVANKVDPKSDIETVNAELILADLETLKKQHEPKQNASKEDREAYAAIQALKAEMNKGLLARNVGVIHELPLQIKPYINNLQLLTMKPMFYVFNVSEKQLEAKAETEAKIKNVIDSLSHGPIVNNETIEQWNNALYLNAKLENEIVAFAPEEQTEYLQQYGLAETGLNRLIKKAYETLGLISILTAGEKEVRAWTIVNGETAQQAAGAIHTDFVKHFIKADIVRFQDFVDVGGWHNAREHGKVQIVGKDHIMQDGDVVEFKIGT